LANRGPPWKLIGIVFTVVTVGAVSASLLAPGPAQAPRDPGVCWRLTLENDKPAYHRIGADIANLETCAAYLERQFLIHGGEINGAFQGRFIFIDGDAIRSSVTLDGSRWRVFFGPQRIALDRKLKEGGKTLNVVTAPAL
jgi:hypothetical protein